MPTITFISTVHEDVGLCNADALREILVRARPDVIFLEIPPASCERVFREESNLESRAVKRFLEAHDAHAEPVDVMEVSSELIAENQRLCRELRARSREYSHLMYTDARCIAEYGFSYINSKYCVETWVKVNTEIVTTLALIGNTDLSSAYGAWKAVHEHREREMLKNIQRYAEEHPFDSAVFLLGAAHRCSTMELARRMPLNNEARIRWNFDRYDGVIDGWRDDAAAT